VGDEGAHLQFKSDIGKPLPPRGAYDVKVETVDGFLQRRGIEHVDFMAIDAEGFDPLVLDGAKMTSQR